MKVQETIYQDYYLSVSFSFSSTDYYADSLDIDYEASADNGIWLWTSSIEIGIHVEWEHQDGSQGGETSYGSITEDSAAKGSTTSVTPSPGKKIDTSTVKLVGNSWTEEYKGEDAQGRTVEVTVHISCS